ncbi:collagen-like protein [Bdellovibrio sp. HCB185ZH]|uniref:collagen-like triple helix repeat-containing protein n=1 Tax=Bdellovibrio sp. HCB185ZH TaxID=3394235 RepID=UPI0039A7390E
MKWGRIGLAVITAIQCKVAFAAPARVDSGFFPIDINTTTTSSVDDLFPTQPRIGTNPGQPGGIVPGPIQINPVPGTPGTGLPTVPGTPGQPGQPGTVPGLPGTANGTGGNGLPVIVKDSVGVADDFKCNLFTNSEDKTYSDILSAVNALNQAVSSPSCAGNQINQQAVIDNNKKITDAIEKLQPFLHAEEEIPKEKVPEITANVDIAIRAASSLAASFSNTDLMNKNCRQQMNGGQVALAINDMINGLTPYALMAASMTGGTAAIPFIVGGQVLTSAIGSMEKIVNENSTKIQDPLVRRAVLENTCQYIRLEQKYRFLTKGRDEQVAKISKEMLVARNYSVKYSGVSKDTNALMVRKNELSQAALELNTTLAAASAQSELDKTFVKSTTADAMICELGINLAAVATDSNSYVAKLLGSVNYSLATTGYSATPITNTLKSAGKIYVQNLQSVTARNNAAQCALTTKYLLEAMDKSAVASKDIMKQAQADLDKQLRRSPEYNQIQARLATLAEKQAQAARITNSLDNLRKYANSFSQSEIDSEMSRLRSGLFETRSLGISSPVMAWFKYTTGLHRASVKQFNEGLKSLQERAFRLTESGKAVQAPYNGGYTNRVDDKTAAKLQAALLRDRNAANNLETLVPANLVKDSRAYADACRETQDVWNRWVSAIDHLAAIESFCLMIDNYIYDNRSEDQTIVQMCRGGQAARGVGNNLSELGRMKAELLSVHTNNWAALVKKRVTALGCQTVTTF